MFSRSCSWPRRKHGCWNSVSSRSGLTRPPCSMWTTFRKPSAHTMAAVLQGWGPGPRCSLATAPPADGRLSSCLALPTVAAWSWSKGDPVSLAAVAVYGWGNTSFSLGPRARPTRTLPHRPPGAGLHAVPLARTAQGSSPGGSVLHRRRVRHPRREHPAGHLHMLSCRTKLAMLLCLKYLGSTSLANWPWSSTWKLFPLCQETCG